MLHDELLILCDDENNAKLIDLLSSNRSIEVVECTLTSPAYATIIDKVVRAAIYSQSIDAFKLLLSKDPTLLNNEQERRGTPLAIATMSRSSLDFLSFLLSEGASPNIFSHDTISPLTLAAGLYDTPDAVKLLLQHGAQLNGSDALPIAASRGKVETVKYLLEQGTDPNDSGRCGSGSSLALHTAVEKGHSDIVKLLLEHGANPQLHNAHGQTALMIAKERGNEEIIQLVNSK